MYADKRPGSVPGYRDGRGKEENSPEDLRVENVKQNLSREREVQGERERETDKESVSKKGSMRGIEREVNTGGWLI